MSCPESSPVLGYNRFLVLSTPEMHLSVRIYLFKALGTLPSKSSLMPFRKVVPFSAHWNWRVMHWICPELHRFYITTYDWPFTNRIEGPQEKDLFFLFSFSNRDNSTWPGLGTQFICWGRIDACMNDWLYLMMNSWEIWLISLLFSLKFTYFGHRERETDRYWVGEGQREEDRESETGSRL